MNLASAAVGEEKTFSNLGYLYGIMAQLRGADAQKQTVYLLQEYKCGKPESFKFQNAVLFTSDDLHWEMTLYLDIIMYDAAVKENTAEVFRLTVKPDGTRTGEILPYPYTRP